MGGGGIENRRVVVAQQQQQQQRWMTMRIGLVGFFCVSHDVTNMISWGHLIQCQ